MIDIILYMSDQFRSSAEERCVRKRRVRGVCVTMDEVEVASR